VLRSRVRRDEPGGEPIHAAFMRPGGDLAPWVAGELSRVPIHSGHHQAERAPDEVASAVLEFPASG